jgi:hypothetical protein
VQNTRDNFIILFFLKLFHSEEVDRMIQELRTKTEEILNFSKIANRSALNIVFGECIKYFNKY